MEGDVAYYDNGTEKDHFIAVRPSMNIPPGGADDHEPGEIGNYWDSLVNKLLGGPFLSQSGGTMSGDIILSYTPGDPDANPPVPPSAIPTTAAVPRWWVTQHVAQGAFNETNVEDWALTGQNPDVIIPKEKIDQATTDIVDWARTENDPKIPFKVLNETTSKIGDWARVHDPGPTDPKHCLLYTSPSPRD